MSKTFTLICTLVCVRLNAYTQNIARADTLEPVTITANKILQPQRSTGKITSIIDKKTIDQHASQSIGQLLNEQAGICVNGSYGSPGSRQSLFVRGASEGRTLILLDGVPLIDPSMINNEPDLNLISLNNIERIEVCKGAQSTLYGSDAIAGVINILTRNASDTSAVTINTTLVAGNYGLYRGGANVSGSYKKFSYSLRYGGVHSAGFSMAKDSAAKNDFDNDGFTNSVVSSIIGYQLTRNLNIKGFMHYSKSRTDLDAAAFSDESDYSSHSKSVNAGGVLTYHRRKTNANLTYRFTKNNRDYLNDSADVPSSTIYSNLGYVSSAHFIDAYVNIKLSTRLALLHGGEFRKANMNSEIYFLSTYGPFAEKMNDTSHYQHAVYTSVFYKSADQKLNIDAGARYNSHSEYGNNNTYSFNASYLLSNSTWIFGGVASAFKAPTLYQLYSPYGERTLRPEKSVSYEAGAEYKTPAARNRLTLFMRHIEHGIDFNYLTYKYYNTTVQKVSGLELESAIRLSGRATLTFNYTYLDPKETSQSRTTFKDTSYHYLLRRPNHMVNVKIASSFGSRFFVSVSGRYVSKRFDIGEYQQPDVVLKGYLLVNAFAEYHANKWLRLFADVQNVTNTHFIEVNGYNAIPTLVNGGFSITL
jgi:vitamin B12 transporter